MHTSKRFLIDLILVLIFSPVFCTNKSLNIIDLPRGYYARVSTNSNLFIRIEPHQSSNQITVVPEGKFVTLLRMQDSSESRTSKWYYVEFHPRGPTIAGWAYGDSLQFSEDFLGEVDLVKLISRLPVRYEITLNSGGPIGSFTNLGDPIAARPYCAFNAGGGGCDAGSMQEISGNLVVQIKSWHCARFGSSPAECEERVSGLYQCIIPRKLLESIAKHDPTELRHSECSKL